MAVRGQPAVNRAGRALAAVRDPADLVDPGPAAAAAVVQVPAAADPVQEVVAAEVPGDQVQAVQVPAAAVPVVPDPVAEVAAAIHRNWNCG